MHACAHDGHTAIGLVLAERIAALADRLNYRIKLFFQPAEEGCRGGKALAAGGQLDDVDALLALHIGIHANSGELVVNPTEFLCSTKFDVEFMGRAAHAGLEPNAGSNALAAACMATTAMLGIARHRDGMTRINVGQLHGGSSTQRDPGSCPVAGAGATPALNDYMFSQVQQMVEGAAMMQGATYLIRKQGEAIGIDNSPALLEDHPARPGAQAGDHPHSPLWRQRGCGLSHRAGAAKRRSGRLSDPGANLAAPHHHPEFDFDEAVLAPAWHCWSPGCWPASY